MTVKIKNLMTISAARFIVPENVITFKSKGIKYVCNKMLSL